LLQCEFSSFRDFGRSFVSRQRYFSPKVHNGRKGQAFKILRAFAGLGARRKKIDQSCDSGLDEHVKPKILLISLTLGFAAAAVSLAGDTKAEQAVRNADAEWSKVAGAKDLDKTVSFYADDAIVLPPNRAAVTTTTGTRDLWKGFLDSLTDISWKTTRVEVAKSGDMAFLVGSYELTMKDGTKDKGKYCEVWKKQSDGKWKVATDMFSSDLPAAPPAETK
jgi:ketosteroid isomerase-like protein